MPGSDGAVSDPDEIKASPRESDFRLLSRRRGRWRRRGCGICRGAEDPGTMPCRPRSLRLKWAFGNSVVYLEKYLERPRHVRIPNPRRLAGNLIHLGDRDCTIQRRHQKLIEESPSTAIDDATRRQMGAAAILAGDAVVYSSAERWNSRESFGRILFHGDEHPYPGRTPVTEEQTDIDLVKESDLDRRRGEDSMEPVADRPFRTHDRSAHQCENPAPDFGPRREDRGRFMFPEVMVFVWTPTPMPGTSFPPYYDSLLAKLITHGKTRDEALIPDAACTRRVHHRRCGYDHWVLSSIAQDTGIPERQVRHHVRDQFLEEGKGSAEPSASNPRHRSQPAGNTDDLSGQ